MSRVISLIQTVIDQRRHFLRGIVDKIDHEKVVEVDTYKDKDMVETPHKKKALEVGKITRLFSIILTTF